MSEVHALSQWLTRFGIYHNHLKNSLKDNDWIPSILSDSVGFRLELRIYISNKLPEGIH